MRNTTTPATKPQNGDPIPRNEKFPAVHKNAANAASRVRASAMAPVRDEAIAPLSANPPTVATSAAGNPAKIYGLSFIYILVMAYNLGFFLGDASIGKAMATMYGFATGFGWIAMALFVVGLFERRSMKLMSWTSTSLPSRSPAPTPAGSVVSIVVIAVSLVSGAGSRDGSLSIAPLDSISILRYG